MGKKPLPPTLCRKCYNKGYASMFGGGTQWTGDFEYNPGSTPHRKLLRFCSCPRGKELSAYFEDELQNEMRSYASSVYYHLQEMKQNQFNLKAVWSAVVMAYKARYRVPIRGDGSDDEDFAQTDYERGVAFGMEIMRPKASKPDDAQA